MRGLYLVKQNTADALARSREFLEQAIALDPGYAEPHVALGESNLRLAIEGVRPSREVMPQARAKARRALALDPSNLDAQAVLGVVAATYDYDWNEVERIWRTVGNRPDVPNAVFLAVDYLGPRRRFSELVSWLQRALQHDPLNGLTRAILGSFLLMEAQVRADARRNADRVERQRRRVLALVRLLRDGDGLLTLGATSRGACGGGTGAIEAAPWHPRVIGMLASALAHAGQHSRADEVIAQLRNTSTAAGAQSGMVHLGMVQTIWS